MSSGAIQAGRSIHLLVVEDSTLDAELAVHELRRYGFEVFFEVVASEAALAGALGRGHWDLVLSDYAMPQFNGLEALRVVRATHAHLPFILLSGVVGEETAVEAMRRGAQDYVLKDRLARLGPAVERELREADRRRQQRQAEQALETMRRQTLLVLDQLPGRVAYLSNDLKYVFVNRHYELDFGMPREQIVGQGVEKILGTATFADALQHLRAALAGQCVSWETDTGKARWHAITFVPDFDIEGKVAGLVVLALDITERKHAEIAMREALCASQLAAEENLARFEAAGAVLQYSDFKQAAAAVVACCARVVGASEGHVCAQRDGGGSNGGLRAEARRTQRTVVANPTGSASLLCAPLIDRTAVVGCLELTGKPGGFTERDVRLADAFAQIAAIALRNSHDRQELAYAEERFRNVVQTATDAVISIDHDRNIVLWNPSAARIFGYSQEEMLGSSVDILAPARFRHVHTAAIARRLETGAATLPARTIEVVGVHKDGREIPAELSLASWRSSEGDFFTAIVRD
ncbi:MAG: PAS domain S-box protein, partial [Myxococcales bacterium]